LKQGEQMPPVVLLLGPLRSAVSGVSTHLNLLFGSALAGRFRMVQFQVGSAGRVETPLGRLARLLASPVQLATSIVRHGVTIVHINTSLDAKAYWRDLVYVLVAKACGARVLYQVHGGAVSAFCGTPPLLAAAARLVLRTTFRWPDVVVVISQIEYEAVTALAPRQRVVLLPNGTDVEALATRRKAHAALDGPLRLLYIGRLVRTKGLYESLEAIARLRTHGVDTHLVIAGSGVEEEGLRREVGRLKLQEAVSFAGPAFGERKRALFEEAQVLLLPTYHREGLPYALLEGMAAGLVPVVTRVGAIPDVVEPDVHGLFVPPRDPETLARALGALAADRALLARMSAASRERVATSYSVERLAGDFTALYRVLGGPWPASKAA
jgi:glycosyltransferase involved in cell wall biosynthesis